MLRFQNGNKYRIVYVSRAQDEGQILRVYIYMFSVLYIYLYEKIFNFYAEHYI